VYKGCIHFSLIGTEFAAFLVCVIEILRQPFHQLLHTLTVHTLGTTEEHSAALHKELAITLDWATDY